MLDTATATEPDAETYSFSRYATGSSETELELKPRLGDRLFIVSPEQPLYLLAGQTSVFYVSTIVWIQASISDGEGRVMLDLPTIRRSDTWFGDNTLEGELCYATKTRAMTELADYPASASSCRNACGNTQRGFRDFADRAISRARAGIVAVCRRR